MSTKFCPNCGAAVDPDTQFCQNCGAAIGFEEPTTKEPQPEPTVPATEEAIPPPPSAPETQVVYAGFWERLLGYIIDAIAVGIIWAIISAVFLQYYYPPWTVPFGLINWIIAFVYFWAFESRNGQTIGKMALKLRTVDEDSLAVSGLGNYFVNNLSRGVWWIIADFIIGILANSGDPKKRYRILQNLSKTVVISEKETT
jgi:uncharacterized RDD family membrane protein YckC